MMIIDLSKDEVLDADPKVNVIGHLDAKNNTKIYFITEEAEETILGFLQGVLSVL